MTQLLPPKKEVALALLERSNVDIYLDPRAKGVVVPPQFKREPRLILKIGLNMPVPIPDLRLDDESMSCTLSFSRTPFYCVVPWPSVFAMVGEDGRGMVWPDDVPQELAVRAADERAPGASAPRPSSSEAEREARPSPAPSSAGGRGRGRRGAGAGSSKEARGGKQLELVGDDRSPKKGRGKKKKDEARRPVLVAVPSPAESEPRPAARPEAVPSPAPAAGPAPVPPPSRQPERRAAKDAPRTPPAAVPASRGPLSSTPSSRPKRELPPYLRVVK
jgi:stringent starvation protein B